MPELDTEFFAAETILNSCRLYNMHEVFEFLKYSQVSAHQSTNYEPTVSK